jgi:subtilase family serine protease
MRRLLPRHLRKVTVLAALPVALGVAAVTAPADASAPGRASLLAHAQPARIVAEGLHLLLPCGLPVAGSLTCGARVNLDAAAAPAATTPNGYGPADIRSAYALPATPNGGGAPTVAIVDAYDNPNLEADLAVYRSTYGLPPCTTANGCFTKVGQDGTSKLPAGDTGWGVEEALDVDMVSAACPACKILVVEANTNANDDLGAAVNSAAAKHPVAISNSYGGNEDNTVVAAASKYYDHPGIAVTASSGDSGYGAQFPASAPFVTAVGGTTLNRDSSTSRGWSESAWGSVPNVVQQLLIQLGLYSNPGAGSGCSAYLPKPTWQHDTGCGQRTVADVSAVADPATGVAVYDTYGQSGWLVVGGTSASSPIIAGAYALAGNTAAAHGANQPYANPTALNDVTAGANGACNGSYLCTAKPGYDGPTGLGTPNGVAAF